jgi:hypothetical protein
MSDEEIDAEETLFQRYALAVLWFQTTNLRIVQQSLTSSDIENPFDEEVDPLSFTAGDIKWKKDNNWMTSKGMCTWHGITCHSNPINIDTDTDLSGDDYDYHVAILNITSNNVRGILPKEVYTAFGKLRALDVSRNGFAGSIAKEVGMLSDLQDLFVFENSFSG